MRGNLGALFGVADLTEESWVLFRLAAHHSFRTTFP